MGEEEETFEELRKVRVRGGVGGELGVDYWGKVLVKYGVSMGVKGKLYVQLCHFIVNL